MISFTSNSKKNLIKIFAFSLFGFISYSFLLYKWQPNVTTFQNIWVENYSAAEKYIYMRELPKYVIVGSSMGNRLIEDSFTSDTYNLSLGGGGVLDGLHIIQKSGRIPDAIFVETNVIERELKHEMIDDLFTPFLWRIKGGFLSLQYTYQPINIALSLMKKQTRDSHIGVKDEPPNEKILEANLERQRRDNDTRNVFSESSTPDELKNLINYFRKKGAKIVFFQMPVHESVLSSMRYRERKKLLLEMFPDEEFHWIKIDDAQMFKTSDGIHLMPHSAMKYSLLLNKIITNGT